MPHGRPPITYTVMPRRTDYAWYYIIDWDPNHASFVFSMVIEGTISHDGWVGENIARGVIHCTPWSVWGGGVLDFERRCLISPSPVAVADESEKFSIVCYRNQALGK